MGFTWKKSKKRKHSFSIKSFFLTTSTVFFSILFLFSVLAYNSIKKPFVSASSSSSSDMLTKEVTSILVVEVGDITDFSSNVTSATVLIVDRTDKKITRFEIPFELEIDIPGDYGVEPVAKILPLAVSVNNDNYDKGFALFNSSISKHLGFGIDYYLVSDSKGVPKILNVLTEGSLLSTTSLFKDLYFSGSIDSLRTNMDLTVFNNYREFAAALEPGDYTVFSKDNFSTLFIDTSLQDIVYNSEVALERKSIAILNGTTMSGLASFGSRVVANMGGRVIATSNTRIAYESSMLIVDDKDSATVKYLVDFFNIETVLDKSESLGINENEISRADITLILGFDIGKNL